MEKLLDNMFNNSCDSNTGKPMNLNFYITTGEKYVYGFTYSYITEWCISYNSRKKHWVLEVKFKLPNVNKLKKYKFTHCETMSDAKKKLAIFLPNCE